jgi:hypothetical protein
MPEKTTIADHIGYRRPKPQPESDPDPQIPSLIQSTRCKSNISSLLLSTFNNSAGGESSSSGSNTKKKKNNLSLRGLGCAASPQVSVPAAIRSSASWEANKVRKKKQKKNKKLGNQELNGDGSTSVVSPDVWCGPGIGFNSDSAASVDCVVSRRARGKLDVPKLNHRERSSSCTTRRLANPEEIPFFDAEPSFRIPHHGFDGFGSRHNSHVRPEGFAQIVMLQSSLMMGGRSDGLLDRYRDLRLDVDNMSYEELLELGERIGHVNTGLREDEIIRSLRKIKLSSLDDLSPHISAKIQRKCSICQEEYELDDEMGKLDCGHLYHSSCIKQWLLQKNACPVCKTEVISQQ